MQRHYFFICACGCGQKSSLLSEYIRLMAGEVWIAKECILENALVVREFQGGQLVKQSDF